MVEPLEKDRREEDSPPAGAGSRAISGSQALSPDARPLGGNGVDAERGETDLGVGP